MKKRSIFWVCISTMLTLASCSSEELSVNDKKSQLNSITSIDEYDKSQLMNQFGQALSKVVFENKEVREFLKNEAVSQFDKNYDILWVKVCNEQIGNKSLRNLLVDKTSETLMDQVEKEIPQLNVLFPKIAMLGVEPEKYDTEDNELPVIVPNDSCNLMYFDGECVDSIPFGDAPAFNVLVVNENSRVIVNNGMKTKSGANSYKFIDPVFDGTQKEIVTKGFNNSTEVNSDLLGSKAINAFKYFNNSEDVYSNNSIYLQRDYIYYGLTPTKQTGDLMTGVKDYITFIEIDPKAYFQMADQRAGDYHTQKDITTALESGDAMIKNPDRQTGTATVSRKKRDFTTEELIEELWTKGAYNIKVTLITSKTEKGLELYIPVFPEEIWDFNLKRDYRHKTLFRHSKYTYTINPKNFTAKRYFLKTPLSLGCWDISEEALERYIYFSEEDLGMEFQDEMTYEMSCTESCKFSGSKKMGLGLTVEKIYTANSEQNISTEITNSNTTKVTRKVTIRYRQDSDNLGYRNLYFYDPIIEGKEGDKYILGAYYNTGFVKFGITAY